MADRVLVAMGLISSSLSMVTLLLGVKISSPDFGDIQFMLWITPIYIFGLAIKVLMRGVK